MNKICGTCQHVDYPQKKGKKMPFEGYCHFMPPFITNSFPKVNLYHRGCHFYVTKAELEEKNHV
jgi:hypothetical protein